MGKFNACLAAALIVTAACAAGDMHSERGAHTGTGAIPETAKPVAAVKAHIIPEREVVTVSLFGEPFDAGAAFLKALYLAIDGATVQTPRNGGAGYEPSLLTADFTGDGFEDILVVAATGGSGGMQNGLVYTWADNGPRLIFNAQTNHPPAFGGRLEDGFRARLVIRDTGEEYRIDLSERRSFYRENGVYDAAGSLLRDVELWGGGYGLIEAVDGDGDGVWELRVVQAVNGFANVDDVAYIESFLGWTGDGWKIEKFTVKSATQR